MMKNVSELLKNLIDIARAWGILFLMLYLGKLIAHLVPIGVPASIWGLLLLFACLMIGFVKLSWINLGGGLLIRYMALFFIPVSVGIIQYTDLLVKQSTILLIPNVVSTAITLIVVGLLSDYLFFHRSFSHLRKKALKRHQVK